MYLRLPALTALIAIIAALAAFALDGPTAGAQTTSITLVSNTGQMEDSTVDLSRDRVVTFTTGAFTGGYALTSVKLDFDVTTPTGTQPTYTVGVFTNSSGFPNTGVTTLVNPSSGLQDGLNEFTASTPILLDPGTTYHVLVRVSTDGTIGASLSMTQSDDENVAETGWSIANNYVHRPRGGGTWDTDNTRTPKLSVHGYNAPPPPVVQSATVEAGTLTITFDGALDENSVPATGSFSVEVTPGFDNAATGLITVSDVDVSGSNVTLTLQRAVERGMTVTVSYTPPASNPLQDTLGTDVAQITDQRVTNNTPPPPVVQSAAVEFSTLRITFNEPLDPDSVPAASAFSVAAGAEMIAVSDVHIEGNTVTLSLASVVEPGTTVTVSYIPPASNPLRDISGNEVAPFSDRRVTVNTPRGLKFGVIYAAPAGGHRVVRADDGNCYVESHRSYGNYWARNTSYRFGSDEEGCRRAAWHAYQRSLGQELLSPRDGANFPTGHPPSLTDFSCPSGWERHVYDSVGRQGCSVPLNDTVSLVLSPERARAFVRLGLRPSDFNSANELRVHNYNTFVYDDPCDEPGVYKLVGGELVCDDPRYPPLQPGEGTSHTDRRAPATGVAIPREAVRGTYVQPVWDSELRRYTSRGHRPFLRDDDGNIVTRERAHPDRVCGSAYWDQHLSQWVCTRDEGPVPGTAIRLEVVKEWDPEQGFYVIKLDRHGNAVTRQRDDPNGPCASTSWHRARAQWVCTYESSPAQQQQEPQQPSAPEPIVHPEASQVTIVHQGTIPAEEAPSISFSRSYNPWPRCTPEQKLEREQGTPLECIP